MGCAPGVNGKEDGLDTTPGISCEVSRNEEVLGWFVSALLAGDRTAAEVDAVADVGSGICERAEPLTVSFGGLATPLGLIG